MKDSPPQGKQKPSILVRLLALLVTAALLFGAMILVVYRDRFNLDAVRRWFDYHNLEITDTGQAVPFSHAGGEQLSFGYLNTGIVLASTTGARYYSFSGEEYAEEITTLEQPVLATSRDTGVVYDAGGRELFVFRGGEMLFHLTLDYGGDLLSARVNDGGWLVVTAQETGYKGSVTVYDSTYTKEMIRINLSSTFVVDAALSPDNKTVAVVTMGQSGGSFHSQVRFYPINQKEPSAIVDLGNMAVLDLDYEAGQLWVLGENEVVIVPEKGGEVAAYSLGRSYLKGCSFGGDGFAFLQLGRYRSGPANQAVVIGPDGTVTAAMELTTSVLQGDANGRYCALLTSDDLYIYTPDLTPYSTLEGTQNARHVALAPSGAAVLASSQEAWMYLPS